jgi:hypothetical protein
VGHLNGFLRDSVEISGTELHVHAPPLRRGYEAIPIEELQLMLGWPTEQRDDFNDVVTDDLRARRFDFGAGRDVLELERRVTGRLNFGRAMGRCHCRFASRSPSMCKRPGALDPKSGHAWLAVMPTAALDFEGKPI